jgi:diguanylate cyclase (GGDEF)-like protein
LTHAERLATGLAYLAQGNLDVVLLDLTLPDSARLDTLARVHAQAAGIAIIVLTGLDDESLAVQAVRDGAQDYIVKGQLESNLLARAIQYAHERKRAEQNLALILREKEMLLIELTRAHAKLETSHAALRELAIRDELTGLYNRREMNFILRDEIQRSRRYGSPLALIMLDIDLFKPVNDTYGHPVGDQVLKALAQLIAESVRALDRPIRYGGEEFAISVPALTSADAATMAERLRLIVANNLFRILNSGGAPTEITLTISLGIAALPSDGDSAETLLDAADHALYEAKRRGRNCVVQFCNVEKT